MILSRAEWKPADQGSRRRTTRIMTKIPIAALSLTGLLSLVPAYAGSSGDGARSYSSSSSTSTSTGVYGTAERELARRQEAVKRAEEALEKGDQAMKEKDYEVAVAQYKFAADQVPESDATHGIR